MQKKVLLMAFGTLLCAGSAVAADPVNDGQINFVGKVVAPACTVVASDKNQTVTLDNASLTLGTMQAAGQAAGLPKAFTINLEQCDTTSLKNAAITFTGEADATTPTALKNQSTTDAATNVALQLYMADGMTKITPNMETAKDGMPLQVDGDAKAALNFSVDYVTTAGAATPGSVTSATTFHINYY